MSAKVPAFSDIGRAARELLYGGKEGSFQFNQALTVSSKTADGVEFTVTTVKKDNAVDASLKTAYKAKNYALVGAFGSSGKVTLVGTLSDIAPGLTATLSGTVPDQAGSGQLGLEYSLPHLTLRSIVGLAYSPKVDIAATTGYEGFVLGAEGSYDSGKSVLTKWTLGAGYNGPDYQVGAFLLDSDTLKASYAHNLDFTTQAGAEVVRKLGKDEATTFTLGLAKRLEGGALTKARLDNRGIVSYLYEQELKPKTKATLSMQLDALNLQTEPKFGFQLAHTS